ncbi:hypothetical protein D3C78_1161580 [compost metagenome]
MVPRLVLAQRDCGNDKRIVLFTQEDRSAGEHSAPQPAVTIGKPQIDGDKTGAVFGNRADAVHRAFDDLAAKAVNFQFRRLAERHARYVAGGDKNLRFQHAGIDQCEKLAIRTGSRSRLGQPPGDGAAEGCADFGIAKGEAGDIRLRRKALEPCRLHRDIAFRLVELFRRSDVFQGKLFGSRQGLHRQHQFGLGRISVALPQ